MSVNSIMAALASAYGTYGPVANATPAGVAAIVAAAETAVGSLTAITEAAGVPTGLPGGITPGGDAPAMAAALVAQAALLTQGAAAQLVLPVAQRIVINLSPPGSAAVLSS